MPRTATTGLAASRSGAVSRGGGPDQPVYSERFLDLYVIAWSRNVSSWAVGASNFVFVDSGVAANLLGVDAKAMSRPGAPFGPLLEAFVLTEIGRQLT